MNHTRAGGRRADTEAQRFVLNTRSTQPETQCKWEQLSLLQLWSLLTRPHARQWWRLLRIEWKDSEQPMHIVTSLSLTHSGARNPSVSSFKKLFRTLVEIELFFWTGCLRDIWGVKNPSFCTNIGLVATSPIELLRTWWKEFRFLVCSAAASLMLCTQLSLSQVDLVKHRKNQRLLHFTKLTEEIFTQ